MRSLTNPVALLAVAILMIGGAGVATAASGDMFILGRSNTATTRTNLSNTAGTALALTAKAGSAPLVVSNSTKVARLNADLVDGLDSTRLQRRITASCSGGAVTGVTSTGGVSCAALPTKIAFSAPQGRTPITIGETTINIDCTVVMEFEGPRLFAYVYVTGTPGIMNGHATSMSYSGVVETSPVGWEIPATLDTAKLPTIEAPELAVSRQSSTLMVDHNGRLTQLTLHLLADARDLNGKPCTLWGTAI